MAIKLSKGVKNYLSAILKLYPKRQILIKFFSRKGQDPELMTDMSYHLMVAEPGTPEWDAERKEFPNHSLLKR